MNFKFDYCTDLIEGNLQALTLNVLKCRIHDFQVANLVESLPCLNSIQRVRSVASQPKVGVVRGSLALFVEG